MQDQMIYHDTVQGELGFHKHNLQDRLEGRSRRNIQFRTFIFIICRAIRTWGYNGNRVHD